MGQTNGYTAQAIKYAIEKGGPVVIGVRLPQGETIPIYGGEGEGATMKKDGAVFACDLSPWKARILLMLALPISKDQKKLQAYFDK